MAPLIRSRDSWAQERRRPNAATLTVEHGSVSMPEGLAPGRKTRTAPKTVPGVRVLKFGGSSVATPERIADVGRIVLDRVNGSPAVLVVSAFQGITNELLECARLAERRDPASERGCDRIAVRHY